MPLLRLAFLPLLHIPEESVQEEKQQRTNWIEISEKEEYDESYLRVYPNHGVRLKSKTRGESLERRPREVHCHVTDVYLIICHFGEPLLSPRRLWSESRAKLSIWESYVSLFFSLLNMFLSDFIHLQMGLPIMSWTEAELRKNYAPWKGTVSSDTKLNYANALLASFISPSKTKPRHFENDASQFPPLHCS